MEQPARHPSGPQDAVCRPIPATTCVTRNGTGRPAWRGGKTAASLPRRMDRPGHPVRGAMLRRIARPDADVRGPGQRRSGPTTHPPCIRGARWRTRAVRPKTILQAGCPRRAHPRPHALAAWQHCTRAVLCSRSIVLSFLQRLTERSRGGRPGCPEIRRPLLLPGSSVLGGGTLLLPGVTAFFTSRSCAQRGTATCLHPAAAGTQRPRGAGVRGDGRPARPITWSRCGRR